jgi:hypothetical protein
VKLLDYRQDLTQLEASTNPFAIIVLAHLTAQETRRDPEARLQAKLAVVRRLYELGYNRVQILRLFRFIDWVLRLPDELEDRFWNDWQAYEVEHRMRYVTSVERIGRREGLKEGLAKGRREGRQEGRQEGLQEGLRRGLELAVKLKFGVAADSVIPEIRRLTDAAFIQTVYDRLETAATVDEVRQALAEQPRD